MSATHLTSLPHNDVVFTTMKKKPYENIVGTGENAGNQHFHLFPQCFLPFPNQHFIFKSRLNYFVVRNCFEIGQV